MIVKITVAVKVIVQMHLFAYKVSNGISTHVTINMNAFQDVANKDCAQITRTASFIARQIKTVKILHLYFRFKNCLAAV